jgi:hypothetical protein
VFFCGEFSQLGKQRKEGVKGIMGFFGKNGPKLPHHEEQKSEIKMFKPLAPISRQFIGGIPIFFTSPFLLAKFGDILLWKIGNEPTSQI